MRRIRQMEPWFGEEEKAALAAYMESGGWLTEFEKTTEFEEVLARYLGAPHCVVTANGTIALSLAMMGLGIGPGDEVIVPDYTMIASANAVRLTGAAPILVDIDPTTLCLDLPRVPRAVTTRTKAMMLVSINGRCPDIHAAQAMCQDLDLSLVEDAAQALGSHCEGRHLGTFGTVGSFSFSVPKVITTGQGGAVATCDNAVAKRVRLIKDFGRVQAGVDRHEVLGYNFKFTDLQAVIGLEQMKKLPWRVERKKIMYGLYRELLADVEEVQFIPTNLEDTSPWFIDVLVPPASRDAMARHLSERGVGTRPFYPAIHTQPPYAGGESDFPNAAAVSERGLWLPSSSFLSDEDIQYVCACIRGFFRDGPLGLSKVS